MATVPVAATPATSGRLPGVHFLVPREQQPAHVRKLRDTYACVPGAPFYRREFWFMPDTVAAWQQNEGLAPDADFATLFHLDPDARHSLGQLGWCEAAFCPAFTEQVIEDRGEHEVVRDWAGRHVLYFKNRRCGFMPEYLTHPVTNLHTWEAHVAWRLDPTSAARFADLPARMARAQAAAAEGQLITQNLVGGYMYLRSLIGPHELLYKFYDEPELIHACMRTWLALADAVIARHQEYVTIDEIFLAEDICYNHGPLIGPDMAREFLLPYYQQLIANLRARQIDRQRHLFIQIDTDGLATSMISFYRELGMDVMSPFEVASGCDVVAVAREYPDLIMLGGIDKRVLAEGPRAIDAMLERILPPMRARGGYTPTLDHGIPAEVSLKNYRHYRERCVELGG